MNTVKDIVMGVIACAEAAQENNIPMLGIIKDKAEGDDAWRVVGTGNYVLYVEMMNALFRADGQLRVAASTVLKGMEAEAEGKRCARAVTEKVESKMGAKELDESVAMVQDLTNMIRRVDHKDNPTIVLTRIGGNLQAFAEGTPRELCGLLAETMLRDGGFMSIATQAADAAIEFIKEHHKGLED